MSDTPRTDWDVFKEDGVELIFADFARQLERELAAAQLELAAEKSRAKNLAAQLNAMQSLTIDAGDIFIDAKELGQLRMDKARLDWINAQVHAGYYNESTGRTELTEFNCHEVKKHGIRATIDAARGKASP